MSTTREAQWLPAGGSAEVWVGADCAVPDPCIIVRLLMLQGTDADAGFYLVPTPRGLDLPSLALTQGSPHGAGLSSLITSTHGRVDVEHVCVGYIRNVVPQADDFYPYPTPWAHVPVFCPVEGLEPICEGMWRTLEAGRSELSGRHWWPIVEHRLASMGAAD